MYDDMQGALKIKDKKMWQEHKVIEKKDLVSDSQCEKWILCKCRSLSHDLSDALKVTQL